jgi:uncharacterized lipoprotein NlpE involved in copper resistance
MKELKRYVCEYCGTEYAAKEKAKKCEANHASKAKVIKEFFQPLSVDRTGVPIKLSVNFSNGKTYLFKRLHEVS